MFHYGDDEYECYRKIKDILMEIGDGWLEIDNEQTYYAFDDKEIKSTDPQYDFTELENGKDGGGQGNEAGYVILQLALIISISPNVVLFNPSL
jgi:hypothetical protein